jgi:single-stranded DNA-specific DHH superfamily exonuclease
VAYTKGAKINISARGLKIRDKIVKIVSELDNATGGGHENAVGAQINKDDLEKFKKKVKDYFN